MEEAVDEGGGCKEVLLLGFALSEEIGSNDRD